MKFKVKEFPDREFSSKEELFHALKENKDSLIAFKKAQLKHTDGIIAEIAKTGLNQDKALQLRDGYFYPVINTINYFDSHKDVHLRGIWNKSVKEQQGKIYYVADHEKRLGSVIAYPADVEMVVRDLSWAELGFQYPGNTQALVYIIKKDRIKLQAAKDVINDGIPIQNSVSMEYVTIDLAVNSTSADFLKEKEVYDKHYGDIVNKEDVDANGYFWAVSQAKIRFEGSMVLFGSNPATPILQNKRIAPPKGTHTPGPSPDTRKKTKKLIFS